MRHGRFLDSATEFSMDVLATKVPTPTILLFISGMVMVATLWFSKKARYVADTEINLSREGDAKERFKPNILSRGLVRLYNVSIQNILKRYCPIPS